MQLVIGGSRKVVIDWRKDSFSLMIRSDQLIYDKFKSLRYEKECTHLFYQIKNHITIFDEFTYLSTNVEEELGE
jgi:hypothetical protein